MVEAKPGRTIEHYTLKKQLGDGQFGVGWLAHDNEENEDVCVKVFKEMDSESEKTFRKEVEAGQAGMKHPNILSLLGAGRADILQDGAKKGDPAFYIVSELAMNGEAYDYVEAAEGLPPRFARQLFKQLLGAVALIHSKGIAHRDLKLENCFLDNEVQVKVADFGLSQAFDGPSGQALKTQCGTPNYMGPELNGATYQGGPADVYAMGVMLFLIAQAQFPFTQAGDVHYRRMHRNPTKAMQDRKINIEEKLLDLIVGMTRTEPNDRYTIQDIQNHEWLKQETATAEEMKAHFYEVTGKAQEQANQNYAVNQQAKQQYVKAHAVNRSHGGAGMNEEEFQAFTEAWEGLEYYDIEGIDKVKSTKGFYAKSVGLYVFSKIFRFIENEIKGDVHVSENNWKMNFTMEVEPEKVELDEEDEKDALPLQKTSFDAEVKLFAEEDFITKDEEGNDVPSDSNIYVQIQRKKGDLVAFGKFVKKLMEEGELKIFVEKSDE